jgi:hypothetical protein
VAFYNQRAAAENLIKEANNDAGLAAHPSGRWMMNCNWFQIAMLAYNLNCWLQLFNREEGGEVATMRHTTLATAVPALDGPGAGDCAGRRWFPAGVEDGLELSGAHAMTTGPCIKFYAALPSACGSGS